MKVAIIGAGLSGMACARVLKQNGVVPDIFEKKDYFGEELAIPAILLRLFSSPVHNPLKFLKKAYHIELKPHFDLKEMVIITSRKSYTAKGKLGYIFKRGLEENAYLRQVAGLDDLPIQYNTYMDAEDIRYSYDYVLIATGDHIAARKMNNMTVQFDSMTRIAKLKGSFDTESVKIWLSTRYSRNGFAYQVSESESEAKLMLIVNDVQYPEFEAYWNLFISEKLDGFAVSDFKDLRHSMGLVKQMKIGNILFAGNAAGLTDSFMGFGSVNAVLSGTAAAHCMLTGKDYNQCMSKFVKDIKKKYEYRKAMNKMNDKDLDQIMTFLTFPGIKQFIYNNPFLRITHSTLGPRLYSRMKG